MVWKPGSHLTNIDEAWLPLRARAGLEDVRLHDLRHSYASRALALGEGLPMIGKLLGHKIVRTTARYGEHGDQVPVADVQQGHTLGSCSGGEQ